MVVSNDPHRFEFDLDRGIQEQVIEKLEASPLLDLMKGVGPPARGEAAKCKVEVLTTP